MSDISDLLGFEPPVKPRLGRPPKPENVRRTENAVRVLDSLIALNRQKREKGDEEQVHMTVSDIYHGVTVSWLGTVFNMDPATVKKRLKDCPPLHRRKTGFVYDLKVAAPYLIKPAIDLDQYLKTMKVSELPIHLQEAYWSAMQKRQAWEEKAGHLWQTEKVLEVLGDVFQTIKFTMQLWPDNIERMVGLTPELRTMMTGMFDEMQKELYLKLKEMPAAKRTQSSLTESDHGLVEIEAPDEDYSNLV